MKTNFGSMFTLAIMALISLPGCVFLSSTSGEDVWSVGMVNDNSIVVKRRAMRNSEGKEEASSSAELRLNQGILDAVFGSNRQDAPADASTQ